MFMPIWSNHKSRHLHDGRETPPQPFCANILLFQPSVTRKVIMMLREALGRGRPGG